MCNFIYFNIKSLLRKKLFFIPVILIFVSILGIYFGNTQAASHSNLKTFAEADYTYNKEQAKKDSTFLNDKFIKHRMHHEKKTIISFRNKQWSQAAHHSKFTTNQDIKSLKKAGRSETDIINLVNQKTILSYVEKHNVYPEISGFGITGFNFLYDVLTVYFPWFWFAILIFILIPIFTSRFQKGKNTDNLIPHSNVKLDSYRAVSAYIVALTIYLFILLIAFGIAGIFNGFGDPNFPIILQGETIGLTKPVYEMILKSMILQILSIMFAISIGQLISNFSKSEMLSAFSTVLIMLLQVISPFTFSFMNSIIQFIPGVYVNAPNILNNYLSFTTKNNNLIFTNGVMILMLSTMIVWFCNISYNQISHLHE